MSCDTWDEMGRKSGDMGRDGTKMGRDGTRWDEMGRKWDEMGRKWDEMGRKWDEMGRYGTKKKRRLLTVSCFIYYECLFYILIQFGLKIFINAIIKIINFR